MFLVDDVARSEKGEGLAQRDRHFEKKTQPAFRTTNRGWTAPELVKKVTRTAQAFFITKLQR